MFVKLDNKETISTITFNLSFVNIDSLINGEKVVQHAKHNEFNIVKNDDNDTNDTHDLLTLTKRKTLTKMSATMKMSNTASF